MTPKNVNKADVVVFSLVPIDKRNPEIKAAINQSKASYSPGAEMLAKVNALPS
ncbi:MAG: hypothetical protein CM1200mP40_29290 [Gammaproteobacteria bacterium]|nr:MAG: hypothetical protein CM1200mP40_29290 [Gammaproteobacteria bacterium]